MKKLIIIIVTLGFLIVANILTNSNNPSLKKHTATLSEVVDLETPISSFSISINKNKINLIDDGTCYKIKSIGYCADDKKIQLFKRFLSNKVNDIYENTPENIKRLGFNSPTNNKVIVINNNKTLIMGKINQYSEIYIQQTNKIYKVNFNKDMLQTNTKEWIDKSKPIIDLAESDKFNIDININRNNCASIQHKNLINDKKFSALRNSFFDLYASDVKPWNMKDDDLVFTIHIKTSNNKDIIGHFSIWKEDHLVYLVKSNTPRLKFVIPNLVYDNISTYCKK
jgi:hypothetical protein